MYTLRVYSHYPYASKDKRDLYRRAVAFLWAFKNGRGYRHADKHLSFTEIVMTLVERAKDCPAFRQPCVAVPVPRSGSSRPSFEPDACEYPCWELAQKLATEFPHVQAVDVLGRSHPVARASDTQGRVKIAAHLDSLVVNLPAELVQAKLVLVDDLITKGTQLMACYRALQQAGHKGEVEAFCVSQTVAPNATNEQQLPYLRHLVRWRTEWELASRSDDQPWRVSRSWQTSTQAT